MPDYSKGKIYTIRCRSNTEYIYVGSTTQPLSKRWGGHKIASEKNGDRLLYSTIGNNWTDWYIELFLEYPCENREQLGKKEGEVIREIGTLDKNVAGRTKKQYEIDNKDKIKEHHKQYYNDNKDNILEYRKQYRIDNVEKIKQYDIDNSEKQNERHKQYRIDNKDKIKQYQKANVDKLKEYQKEYRQKKKLEKQQNTAQLK